MADFEKVKPCPFCGKVPVLPKTASVENINILTGKSVGLIASIWCSNCNFFILGKKGKRTDILAIKEVLKRWNTRNTEDL